MAGAPTRKMTPQPARNIAPKQTPEAHPKLDPVAPAGAHDHDHEHDHDHDHDHAHEHPKPKPRPTLEVFTKMIAEEKSLTDDLRRAMLHIAHLLEDEASHTRPRVGPLREFTARLTTMIGSFTTGSTQKELLAEIDGFDGKLKESLS